MKNLRNSFSAPGSIRRERGRLFDTLSNLSIMRGAIHYRFGIDKTADHNESGAQAARVGGDGSMPLQH